jgi:tetratricopeptide (TPR) repeat protein
VKRLAPAAIALLAACESRAPIAPDVGFEDRRGLVATALDARDRIELPRFRTQLRAEIGHSFAKRKLSDEATRELEAALSEAALLDRLDRDRLRAQIALGFARNGAHDRALTIASTIETPEARSEALSGLVHDLAEAKRIESPIHRDRALLRLANEAANRGEMRKAWAFADACQDPSLNAQARVFVVRAAARTNDKKVAKKITTELSGVSKSEAYAELAFAAIDAKDRKTALRVLEMIEAEYVRAKASIVVAARSSADRSRLDRRAMQIAEDVRDPILRASTYEAIVRAWIDEGEPKKALEVLKKAEGLDSQLRLRALAAARLIDAGQLEAGEKEARQIARDPVWSPEAFTHLARAHAAAGRWPEALQAVRDIQSLEFRLPALADVLVIHDQDGKVPSPGLRGAVEQVLSGG